MTPFYGLAADNIKELYIFKKFDYGYNFNWQMLYDNDGMTKREKLLFIFKAMFNKNNDSDLRRLYINLYIFKIS